MGRQLDELSVFFSGDPPFTSHHCVIVLLLVNKLMMMMNIDERLPIVCYRFSLIFSYNAFQVTRKFSRFLF